MTHPQKFYLFGWNDYYPAGGLDDYMGSFELLQDAVDAGRKWCCKLERHGALVLNNSAQVLGVTPSGDLSSLWKSWEDSEVKRGREEERRQAWRSAGKPDPLAYMYDPAAPKPPDPFADVKRAAEVNEWVEKESLRLLSELSGVTG